MTYQWISLWCIGLTGKATCLNRKYTKHCLRKPIIVTLFSKIFILNTQDTCLIACANCLQKSQILKKKKPKSQTIFLTAATSKKSQICDIWRQKANLATLSWGITLIEGPAGRAGWRAVFPNEKREFSAGWTKGRSSGLQKRAALRPALFRSQA